MGPERTDDTARVRRAIPREESPVPVQVDQVERAPNRAAVELIRYWVHVGLVVAAGAFAVSAWLVTRASSADLERTTARVVQLEAHREDDREVTRYVLGVLEAHGKQLTEIAIATGARLVAPPPSPAPLPR